MSIDPYDHVICIKCYYRELSVKMLKFAFLGVYGYTPYQCSLAGMTHDSTVDTRCTGMNMKVRKMQNKDQVPQEKP